jgi:hypothetical protein
MTTSDRPFNTIESAHEYLSILSEQIDEVMKDVRAELMAANSRKQDRRTEAWELVHYTLTKLSFYTANSRRLVNDLRTMRNLLYRTGGPETQEILGERHAEPSETSAADLAS